MSQSCKIFFQNKKDARTTASAAGDLPKIKISRTVKETMQEASEMVSAINTRSADQ